MTDDHLCKDSSMSGCFRLTTTHGRSCIPIPITDCRNHWPPLPVLTAVDSTSSGRKGFCTEDDCLHPNNEHKYGVCKARGCKKQWKRCQACDPWKICTSCGDHPAATPFDSLEVHLGDIRAWGNQPEPLSAS